MLEQLYTDGILVIHHKNGSRKFYDLAERYLDPELLSANSPCEDEYAFLRWRVLRRIGAVGLLWDKNSMAFLGIQMNAEQRRQTFSALEAEGTILPVRIEGIRALFYYRSEDDPLMQDVLSGRIDRRRRLEFLAPLDPLLWDKALIAALWDFHYSWEIYTPADKRKYGYYTLPVLWGERFIGRIEAAADHTSKILRVKNIWFEPDIRLTKELRAAISRTLMRFAKFNGCTAIEDLK